MKHKAMAALTAQKDAELAAIKAKNNAELTEMKKHMAEMSKIINGIQSYRSDQVQLASLTNVTPASATRGWGRGKGALALSTRGQGAGRGRGTTRSSAADYLVSSQTGQ